MVRLQMWWIVEAKSSRGKVDRRSDGKERINKEAEREL